MKACIFFVPLALLILAVLLMEWAKGRRGETKPGQRGIRPGETVVFSGLIAASLACLPASLVGYIGYLVVHGAADDKVWGTHWGNVWFWALAATSLGGFFVLLWNSTVETRTVETGFNASLNPFGRRWRRYVLSEGNHSLFWFITVSAVDMRRTPGKVIEFTESSQDKTLISFKGNWMRQIEDLNAFLDTNNADYALDVELGEAGREYIRNHTDDVLTGPKSDKTALKEYINAALRKLATYAVIDPMDPNVLEANIIELLPPPEETQAAADKKAKKIDLDGYNERVAEFRAKNSGLTPQEALAGFERLEGKRKTDHVILEIPGLGNLPPTAQGDVMKAVATVGVTKKGGG